MMPSLKRASRDLFGVRVVQSVPEPKLNVCVGGGFSTPTSNSRMSAGCLRFQLNSDTIYLEIDSTGKGLSSTRPSCTSDTSDKLRLLTVHLTDPLLGFD